MSTGSTDRAAALRAAVRSVVAERGLHGASVSQIASVAGVATGTAYVHYDDKVDLVLAAYVEAKQALGAAALSAGATGGGDDARARFVSLWLGAYRHLRSTPADARFILQVDVSPHAAAAHTRMAAEGADPLQEEVSSSGLRTVFADLDDQLLYELALAPAVRLAARSEPLTDDELVWIAHACFAAATTDRPDTPERTASARPLHTDVVPTTP